MTLSPSFTSVRPLGATEPPDEAEAVTAWNRAGGSALFLKVAWMVAPERTFSNV